MLQRDKGQPSRARRHGLVWRKHGQDTCTIVVLEFFIYDIVSY